MLHIIIDKFIYSNQEDEEEHIRVGKRLRKEAKTEMPLFVDLTKKHKYPEVFHKIMVDLAYDDEDFNLTEYKVLDAGVENKEICKALKHISNSEECDNKDAAVYTFS
jgi:hypothetical protein